jgi:hypothetical protein
MIVMEPVNAGTGPVPDHVPPLGTNGDIATHVAPPSAEQSIARGVLPVHVPVRRRAVPWIGFSGTFTAKVAVFPDSG